MEVIGKQKKKRPDNKRFAIKNTYYEAVARTYDNSVRKRFMQVIRMLKKRLCA